MCGSYVYLPVDPPCRALRRLGRVLSSILALAVALGPATPQAAEPGAEVGLKLERVVLLMRHGIRPPTKATVTPPGIAAAPWPKWDRPTGT